MKRLSIMALLSWSCFSLAHPGDYANYAPEEPKIPVRQGSGIACGPWDINDYGTHAPGTTSVTIYTRWKGRPDLKYIFFDDFDSASAHEFLHVNDGRCACVDYTYTSGPTGFGNIGYTIPRATSPLRDCPPQGHSRRRR